MLLKVPASLLFFTFIVSSGCSSIYTTEATVSSAEKDRVTAYRFRTDLGIDIDENMGWGGQINESPSQKVDKPFRVRFEVESNESSFKQYSLQYQYNDQDWQFVQAQHFPYPSAASPQLSIIGCHSTFFGEEADDLLEVSALPSDLGASICLAPTTPVWEPSQKSGTSAEFEWTLVVRHWADGPVQINDGDSFSLRVVDQQGHPLTGKQPSFSVSVPEKHVGGTFVETPGRIGPYENAKGELYFIMEPTETGNIFMMIKSDDSGTTWSEIDGKNRPKADDLEGVSSAMSSDGVIHIIHQTSDFTYYHAFATSDNEKVKEGWIVTDVVIEEIAKPDVQTADIVVRPDGSIIAMYAVGSGIHYNIRDTQGNWGKPLRINDHKDLRLTNPLLLAHSNGDTTIAYKTSNGLGWARTLSGDNLLSSAEAFASDLGVESDESMAILPLAFSDTSEKTVLCYRQSGGLLFCKTRAFDMNWSKAIQMTDKKIVTNAVDSDQAGADLVVFEDRLYVPFIDETNRDLYLASVDVDFEDKPTTEKLVSDIDGAWVRGNILLNQRGSAKFGIMYDAGSMGGSGFNKFHSVMLDAK